MKLSALLTLAMLSVACAAMTTRAGQGARNPGGPAPATAQPSGPVVTDGGPAGGPHLPDTTVLARVDDRVIRAFDFRDRYFATYALDRPASDSAGRVEFLNSLVKAHVMALTALGLDRPLTFEDRLQMRARTNTALQNVLFQRAVLDTVSVTDREIRDTYKQFGYEQHLRHILFRDRATAERVRLELVSGRIPWNDAVRKYSEAKNDSGPDGDLGWMRRAGLGGDLAMQVFALEPGTISGVIPEAHGHQLIQSVGRRNIDSPALAGVRTLILSELRSAKRSAGVERLYEQARALAGATYDSANIRWATAQFAAVPGPPRESSNPVIDLGEKVPRISPADTGRVLASTRDRRFTLGQFIDGYRSIPTMLRRRIGSFDGFVYNLNGMFLEPEMVKLALARGIDKDSLTLATIEKRREELLVEHLYQDSVLNRVSITPEERRQFYEEHRHEYLTVAAVRYARIVRGSEGEADALVARLKAGERAEAVVRVDSLQGRATSAILEAREDQPGSFHKILFEELKPGQATKLGPDRNGNYLVFQVLSRASSREMTYQEGENQVDQSLGNIRADSLLDAFLERHKGRYRIEVHPELLMRVLLVDPLLLD